MRGRQQWWPLLLASDFTNENQRLRGLGAKQIREEPQTNLRKNDLLRVNSVTLCVSVVKLLEKTFTTEARRSHREPQRVTLRTDFKEVWAQKIIGARDRQRKQDKRECLLR